MYNFDQMIYITSNSRTWISALSMVGPIVHPIRVPVKAVSAMLMSGHNVQEYDPTSGRVVDLTLSNYRDEFKFDNEAPVQERTLTTVYTDGVPKEAPVVEASTPDVNWSSLSKAERKKMKRELASSNPSTEDSAPEETVVPDAPVEDVTETPAVEETK